jgi:hypothetical protein
MYGEVVGLLGPIQPTTIHHYFHLLVLLNKYGEAPNLCLEGFSPFFNFNLLEKIMYPKCERCGTCCLIAPCGQSRIKQGVCKHLVVNSKDLTSCSNLRNASLNGMIGLGTGCVLRQLLKDKLASGHLEEHFERAKIYRKTISEKKK